MVKIINLTMAQQTVGFQREAAYNALDTIATLEIDNVLDERMSENDKRTHDFYLTMQGPAMEMTMRGININMLSKEKLRAELQKELQAIERKLANHPEIKPIWDHMEKNTGACHKPSRKDGKHKWERGVPDTAERKCLDCGASRLKVRAFKPSSDDDVKHLLYDLWHLKPVTNKDHKVTADKEARERIIGRLKAKEKKYEEPIQLLDKHADLSKQIGFLKFNENDGRFHSSFNVGVTGTHRWSSNQDGYGRGGNAQNITEKHRYIFEADPGMELCYADLKQAESKVISFVSGDEAYIEAHEVGDTHTFVCRLVWPEGVGGQEWTWDLKQDKKIAKSHNPPWDNKDGHDYRFQSKAVQHGSIPDYGEVLTRSGWKRMADVADDEAIVSWSEAGLEWSVPVAWTRWYFNGDLVVFDGRNIQQHVTPNHRMPVFNNGKFVERLADAFYGKVYGTYPVNGTLHSYRETELSPTEARLMAATWSDGNITSNVGRTRFGLTKQRKKDRLRLLMGLAGEVWNEAYYKPTEPNHVTVFINRVIDKRLTWDAINWPYPARRAFLEELPLWDGHVNPVTGQIRIIQVDKEQLEIIQAMAHITGMSGTIYKHGKPRPNEQQAWVLSLQWRATGSYRTAKIGRIRYDGMVHSPTVSSGWFLTRLNGVISVTGNSNLGLTPFGMSIQKRIPVSAAQEGQERYFKAFPGIRQYQSMIRQLVQDQQSIVTPLGIRFQLFGRPWDEHTYKSGLSVIPQATVGHIISIGIWRIWTQLPDIQLLAQVHDAILFQFPKGRYDLVYKALELMTVPVQVTDVNGKVRTLVIGTEAAVGHNWSHHSADNPDGLREITFTDENTWSIE